MEPWEERGKSGVRPCHLTSLDAVPSLKASGVGEEVIWEASSNKLGFRILLGFGIRQK